MGCLPLSNHLIVCVVVGLEVAADAAAWFVGSNKFPSVRATKT